MKLKSFLGFFLAAVLGGASVLGLQSLFKNNNEDTLKMELNNVPAKQVNYSGISETNTNFSEAAKLTINAVVHVKTVTSGTSSGNDIYSFFFGTPYQRRAPVKAAGSGVIISSDGYIVTNNHVIKGADVISVTLNDNREYTAKLIGADPATDIALIKIEAENLPVVVYGDSDEINIGDWVLAVGNPFNLTSTVTAGIVSAKARNINILQERYAVESFIQTDAAVNPGNSGGALVNTKGELMGINTAIASQTGSFAGYSFAVPVNIVKKIVADLMEYGTVQRAMLGVSITDINNRLVEELALENTDGVYVMGVGQNSSAMDAGIEAGDIILKINDRQVNNVPELQEQISKHRPGDIVEVVLKRNGRLHTISVTLKNRVGTTEIMQKNDIAILGASFENLTKQEAQSIGLSGGVRISDIRSGKLMKAGVREGFIIIQMNRRRIYSTDDLVEELNVSKGGVYVEGIYPDGSTAYYAFGLK